VAVTLLRRIEFHYSPQHASWLNMAEIEIWVLQRQCLSRCAAEQAIRTTEVAASATLRTLNAEKFNDGIPCRGEIYGC
jgi:hypothetical protein